MDGLWGNDQAYVDKYLSSPEGWYLTGDAGQVDEEGYLYVLTRTDDVINTAGHRISTGRIEEVLTDMKSIAECAVVGKEDKLKGEVPVAYVIVQDDTTDKKKIQKEI